MKTIMAISLFTFYLFSQSCSVETANVSSVQSAEENRNGEQVDEQKQNTLGNPLEAKSLEKVQIGNTKGLLVLNHQRLNKKDFIRIYDDDGSVWYKFTFYYDDSDGKFEYENKSFRPFAFHPDYFLLALRLTSEDKNHFEVIVNEDTGLKKFVLKKDQLLRFESWEDHILNAFAVDFDKRYNALRRTPDGEFDQTLFPENTTFHPIKINGQWLKVRIDPSDSENKSAQFGWIKWKENNTLLIKLFYFS